MKRIILLLLTAVTVMMFCLGNSISADSEDEILAVEVFLNNNRLSFDVPPVIASDRIFVPMRKIFEELGYTIDWNEAKQRVVAIKGDLSVQLDIGDTLAILNDYDSAVELDAPAQIINGRTMVPLRFVAEASNYDVLWDGSSKTVHIKKKVLYSGVIRKNQPVAMQDGIIFYIGNCEM